ncbi:MAG TPA: hypothetical protein EYG46_14970 [Myxococcales bacterium]|nr:hypothetical protein [Myxococcales bacterium]HIM02283.1 hypothetical protein [Myxococcales bacterium]
MKQRRRDRLQRSRPGLVAANVILVLIAVLTPSDPPWTNKTRWREPGPGLKFGGVSQLLSEAPIISDTGELTLEVWLVPGFTPGIRPQEIISFYEPAVARRSLVLGQFPRGFILQGRADNPSGDPRNDEYIGIDEVGLVGPDQLTHLALTVTIGGTTLHVNGRPTALHLRETAAYKGDPFGGHLLIGSSNAGWHFWLGGMMGVAVYDRVLTEAELISHARRSGAAPDKALDHDASLLALYRFEEGGGRRTRSAVARGPDLTIPERMTRPTRKTFLSTHAVDEANVSLFMFDIVSNIAGFMPLAFLLAWKRGVKGVVVAVLAGFALSLFAELAQTQIVGRASSLVDLVCNTLGALLGGALAFGFAFALRFDPDPR